MAEMPSKVEFDIYMVPKGSFVSSSRAGTVHLGTISIDPMAVRPEEVEAIIQDRIDGLIEKEPEKLTGTGIREVPS